MNKTKTKIEKKVNRILLIPKKLQTLTIMIHIKPEQIQTFLTTLKTKNEEKNVNKIYPTHACQIKKQTCNANP